MFFCQQIYMESNAIWGFYVTYEIIHQDSGSIQSPPEFLVFYQKCHSFSVFFTDKIFLLYIYFFI